MKNVLISLQLFVFMVIGIGCLSLFGTLITDKLSGEKINGEIEFAATYSETHSESVVAYKILELAEDNKIVSIINLCELYNIKLAIYAGHSRPIYNNMVFNNMTRKDEQTASYYTSDNFTMYMICNEPEISNTSRIYYIAPIWRFLYARIWLVILGSVISIGLFALAHWLMSKYGTTVNKVWVYLCVVTLVEVGMLYRLGFEVSRFLICFVVLEKVIIAVGIYCILHRLGNIYGRIQKMAYEGNSEGANNILIKPFTMKDFEKDMESVSEYVSEAVSSKLKSERLRTELITNVSHDIKTPLTSVINFADLINKEAEPDTTIAEYSEHLHKQSIKLKELLDALLDASKAASGALETNMELCDVHILLEQCVVEYEDRMSKANIELIEKYPEEAVKIKADVRFLHRIFENILINICKYAMPGTRAYIDAKVVNGKVCIAFKNTSKEPLDISADELMERFVRGDKSRHTEGHGLGLSVVSSLMELQNAKSEIEVNADLFVITLVFQME